MPAADTRFPPPSGEQYEIVHGGHRAVLAEVGAILRSYTVDGADVIDGFPITDRSSGGRGQVLAPWPNRLGDGVYDFEGRQGSRGDQRTPDRGNAIHGLVRWNPWQLISRTEYAAELGCVVHPSLRTRGAWSCRWNTSWVTTA